MKPTLLALVLAAASATSALAATTAPTLSDASVSGTIASPDGTPDIVFDGRTRGW